MQLLRGHYRIARPATLVEAPLWIQLLHIKGSVYIYTYTLLNALISTARVEQAVERVDVYGLQGTARYGERNE